MPQITYQAEIWRKLIHLSSLSIPFLSTKLDFSFFLNGLILVALIALLADFLRAFVPHFAQLIQRFFGFMLRKEEQDQENGSFINGSTWVLWSGVLLFSFFSTPVAICAFATLIIGDAFAALVGRKFGRIKIGANKTLEGSLAFFITAFGGITLLFPILPTYVLALGVLAGAIIELVPFKFLNDNISIPLTTAFVLQILI